MVCEAHLNIRTPYLYGHGLYARGLLHRPPNRTYKPYIRLSRPYTVRTTYILTVHWLRDGLLTTAHKRRLSP